MFPRAKKKEKRKKLEMFPIALSVPSPLKKACLCSEIVWLLLVLMCFFDRSVRKCRREGEMPACFAADRLKGVYISVLSPIFGSCPVTES